MKFYTIRQRPELMLPMLETLREHWNPCAPWVQRHMMEVLNTPGPLPEAWVAVENGEVAGGYTLTVKEILWQKKTGLWIATLYVDPKYRGRGLSRALIRHARVQGHKLGYEKIYLATEHQNYYEKMGFHAIGPDAWEWGEPTRMFEHTTLRAA